MPDGGLVTYHDAMAFLNDRINYERAAAQKMFARGVKLDRMRELLALLGNPQETIPVVHIAGTKGKGSTAVMAAGILTASGYRTGLFTSPHVSVFEERMRVDGVCPSAEECVELVREVAAAVAVLDGQDAALSPTYFEIATAMAWLYFREAKCDFVVLEVGLGGRLDATNLCRPEVTVITNVSRDHTSILGNTKEKIAREKAGIIKPHVPLVSGVDHPGAREVVRQRAAEQRAAIFQWKRDFRFQYTPKRDEDRTLPAMVNVVTPWNRYNNVPLPLAGIHQAQNAALAVTAIDVLRQRGYGVPVEAVGTGMAGVRWPLRLEVVQKSPMVIVDAAHNAASAEALVAALKAEFPARRNTLIFAASRDKNVERLAEILFPYFDDVILTRFVGNPRAIPPEEIRERTTTCPNRIAGDEAVRTESPATDRKPGFSKKPGFCAVAENPHDAVTAAMNHSDGDDLTCATGSFYLAAEVRSILLEQHAPGMPPEAVPMRGS